jgi:hypothetical protein
MRTGQAAADHVPRVACRRPIGVGRADGSRGQNGSRGCRSPGQSAVRQNGRAIELKSSFSLIGWVKTTFRQISRIEDLRGFIVANFLQLCHKRSLHRPADQGLPWRCACWLSHFGNNLAFSTL